MYPYVKKSVPDAQQGDFVVTRNMTDPSSVDTVYSHYDEGDSRTYRESGGVVMYAQLNATQAAQTFLQAKTALDLKLNWMAVEFITYIPNVGIFVWTTVRLDLLSSGRIQTAITNKSFRVTQYPKPMRYRALFEVVFCLFIFYYTYCEILEWVLLWAKQRVLDNESYELHPGPNDGFCRRLSIFLYVDPEKILRAGAV